MRTGIIRSTCAALRAVVDFVYPPNCVLCGSVINGDLTGRFCDDCHAGIWPGFPYSCRRCGGPLGPHIDEGGTAQRGCYLCRRDRFRFSTVHRLGSYDEMLQLAILRAKLRHQEPLIAGLTELMWEFSARLREFRPRWIVPVPQHWNSRFHRPHNPPDVIADRLARHFANTRPGLFLRKTRITAPQSSLSPTERRKNLRNAFRVPRRFHKRIKDQLVLLVDDVLTTGTTANECARALLAVGARDVQVAVIARGIGTA